MRCRVRLHDMRDLVAVVARVRRLLDLDADPVAVDAALGADPALAPLVAKRPGCARPGAVDGFEMAVRTVVGQQISVARRAHGARPASSPSTASRHSTASRGGCSRPPAALADVDPATLPMPRARGRTRRRAGAGSRRRRSISTRAPTATRPRAALLALPGIGPWTADYLRMRATRRPGRAALRPISSCAAAAATSASTWPTAVRTGRRGAATPRTTCGRTSYADAWADRR